MWQPHAGAFSATVVCKITLVLAPDEMRLADEQDPIRETDVLGERGNLLFASDLAPMKPRVDVVLVGSAFAPGGTPVQKLTARLCVGPLDKSIDVHADRSVSGDGEKRQGPPFARMPLTDDRTRGGAGAWTLSGVRREAGSDSAGWRKLPNLTRKDAPDSGHLLATEPVGFGPIPPAWPRRRARLGRHEAFADPRAFRGEVAPPDFNFSYFNVAPTDQQLELLEDDAPIVLECLHAAFPRLSTRLLGVSPTARIEEPGRAVQRILLRPDTLWLDTDRGVCALTYRRQVPLPAADAPGRIVVEMPEIATKKRRPRVTLVMDVPDETTSFVELPQGPTLPFAAQPQAPPSPESARRSQGGLPFLGNAPPIEPPAPVAKPEYAPLPKPEYAPPPKLEYTPPEYAPPLWNEPPSPPFPVEPAKVVAEPEPPPSPAAAEPEPEPPPEDADERPKSTLAEGEALELLWLAREAMPRIRRRTPWRDILDDLADEPIDPEHDEPTLSATPAFVEDRRDVVAILSRGEPASPETLKEALSQGVSKGAFTAKMTLIAGELSFAFDEVKVLTALVATITPLAVDDERLRGALRSATDFLGLAGASSLPGVAEGLSAKIRELLRQGSRMSALEGVSRQVERSVLEQRAYQRRLVFGSSHLRGAIASGQGPTAQAVPVYFPDAIAAELPLMSRFAVRIVAEVHPQTDQIETSKVALRAVALGRVLSFAEANRRT